MSDVEIIKTKAEAAKILLEGRQRVLKECMDGTTKDMYDNLNLIEEIAGDNLKVREAVRMLRQQINTCYTCFDSMSREATISIDRFV